MQYDKVMFNTYLSHKMDNLKIGRNYVTRKRFIDNLPDMTASSSTSFGISPTMPHLRQLKKISLRAFPNWTVKTGSTINVRSTIILKHNSGHAQHKLRTLLATRSTSAIPGSPQTHGSSVGKREGSVRCS